jgi:23S rRNA (guanine745-N1)-methyltransferase
VSSPVNPAAYPDRVRDDLLPALACPVCRQPLARVGDGSVGCAAGHRYDEARQGSLTLLPARRRALVADTVEMVGARIRFLGSGHYAPIASALASAVGSVAADGVVLDVGSGPGTYLAGVLDAVPDRLGIALDLSPVAIRRAARIHERAGAVVGDVTERLPVVDGAAAVVLDVFAPRNQAEYARVLAPGGLLVVVTPRDGHLRGVPGIIRVDPAKEQRLRDSLTPSFVPVGAEDLTWTMELTADEVSDVVHMGPSHHHVAPDATFPPATVTAAVTVSTWRARERPA